MKDYMTLEMRNLVDEKVAERVDKIRGDFHDDFLAQQIRNEVHRAFKLSTYDLALGDICYYAYYKIEDWYREHKLVVEQYDKYSYGDF